ncbi:glycosyltransferase [Evansella sp. AB-rgal1]|uniref:glycosyltransferase n=1 Tax=Evansella sp. AB-rgal1 TaxID=3242696 RepID=UPI00359E5E31
MKSACRVIHIIGGGEFGGAEDHIIHLLKELKNENMNPLVVCFYDSIFAEYLREQGIRVKVLDYGRFDLRLLFALMKLLKEENPDIVHTHGVKANFFGRIAAKRVGISPVVTTVHSILKYDYEHPIAYRLAYMLERSTRDLTDYFIAISNKIQDQLLEDGINSSKVQIIHHGIDTNKFAPRNDQKALELAEEWGKSSDTFLIGAIGRIQAVKGFDNFVRACSELHKVYPDSFRFVLIGDGSHRKELEQLVERENIQDVFTFAGFRGNIDSCLRALDCYVSSSLSEGLGLSVMEALSTGVPVVTTGVGGVKDFAKDEDNSLVVEPKSVSQLTEAIERIYKDDDLKRKLTDQGRNDIISTFSLKTMGENTAYYYRKWLETNN